MFREPGTVEQNAAVTEAFVETLGGGTSSPRRPGTGIRSRRASFGPDVAGRAVAGYLRSLAFPPRATRSRGRRLAGYIEDQIRVGELTDWTVFLATGEEGPKSSLLVAGSAAFAGTPRGDRSTSTRFIVKSILNPPDEAIDLADDEFVEALRQTNDERRLAGQPETKRPSGPSVRAVRGRRPQNGLLIIYPLDPV